jgi:HEPN domain-containing protein
MTAREIKIRQEDRSAASEYLKKAADNYEQMLTAFNASNWNAAATLAVQCTISSADAVCVYGKGVRSISQDHFDVCDLVAGLPLEGAEEKSKQLRKIIARKNLVQYECRSVNKSDADEMVKVTMRFYQWVRDTIEEI